MASIRKRSNGKFEVQIRRKGFAPVSRTFHKHKDAEAWARHTETIADRGELPTPMKVLNEYQLKNILSRYRDEVTIKKRSADTENYIINAFIRQPIANLTLAELNTSHFSLYRDKRLKNVKAGTVNRELTIIQHALDIAEREWNIPLHNNPVSKLKKLKVNNARTRRITENEIIMLEKTAYSCRNKIIIPLIHFAIATAMRRGEIINTKWKHIDWDNKTLFIPKTKNGYSRIIPLSTIALEILKSLSDCIGAEEFVFPISNNAAKLSWQRIVKRSNIHDLHFHDLRHEAISRFFEKGLSLPEVALISGHRDYRMLFRYTHLKAEDLAIKLV